MIIFIPLFVCTLGLLYWMHTENKWDQISAVIAMVLLVGTLFICTIIMVSTLVDTPGQRAAFLAAKTTIEQSRSDDISEFERARLTERIIECNQWLASNKARRENVWLRDFAIDVTGLEPIQ